MPRRFVSIRLRGCVLKPDDVIAVSQPLPAIDAPFQPQQVQAACVFDQKSDERWIVGPGSFGFYPDETF